MNPGRENQRIRFCPPREKIVCPERTRLIWLSLSSMVFPRSPIELRGKGQSSGEPLSGGRFIPIERSSGSGMKEFSVFHFFADSALRAKEPISESSPLTLHLSSPLASDNFVASVLCHDASTLRGVCFFSFAVKSPPSHISICPGQLFSSCHFLRPMESPLPAARSSIRRKEDSSAANMARLPSALQ